MIVLWIILGVVVLLVVVGVSIYNRLVLLSNRVRNAFAQIDVQLKRRYELIPNLVEAVKGYMQHEKETLERVTAARTDAQAAVSAAGANPADGKAIVALAVAEQALGRSLNRLFARVEAYPQLKASENIGQLMEELASTENRVAFARQAYNDSVMTLNTSIHSFPNLLLASPMGFRDAQLFEATDSERQAVTVSLNNP